MTYRLMLTFTEEEKWLYDIIKSKSCKGGFIKDILKEHLKQEKE